MPRRVDADPHVVLRLEVRERRARLDRVRDALLDVVDLDLQVHHHLLVARAGRPDGAHVPLLGLEVQRVTAARRLEDDPAGSFRASRPAEQSAVEVRERVGVGRVDVGPGHGQPWHPGHPLVKVSSSSVVVSWVLPAARTNTSDFTGPVSGAVQVLTRTLVLKLPTFIASTMSTVVAW